MEKYTDIKIKKLLNFLFFKWKKLIIISIFFGIVISLSFYISYNNLDTYFPEAMTETNIINKINRIKEEIKYLDKIKDENEQYFQNSIYYSYNNNGAVLHNVQLLLPKSNNSDINNIILELNNNLFFEYLKDQLHFDISSKYLRELFVFSSDVNQIEIKISLGKNVDVNEYINVLLNYLKTKDLIDDDYIIKYISQSDITKTDLKEYYLSYTKSTLTNESSIQEREEELNLYQGYLKNINSKLETFDYIRILVFSISYIFIVSVLILIFLFIKKNLPMTKQEYLDEGIVFGSKKIQDVDILKLNSLVLLVFALKKQRYTEQKNIIIYPGTIARKSLISFYNNNTELNYCYYEDFEYEK